MKKAIAVTLLAGCLALTGCSGGAKIVPIDSLSPAQTAANVYSAQPAATPAASQEAIVLPRFDESGMTVSSRINPPSGYARTYAAANSFASFMRAYPLKSAGASVLLYTGEMREDAAAAAVLDIDLGKKNHEGPAGAVARLYSEYEFAQGEYSKISFTFGSSFDFNFDRWRQGYKLKSDSSNISWVSGGTEGESQENFQSYLTNLFVYISMNSLKKDLVKIEDVDTDEVQVGDLYLGTDKNGKATAVMVADLCQSAETGQKLMLLCEGGIPAQQAHILENPGDAALSPWYPVAFETELVTPDVTVQIEDRYRYKNLVETTQEG